MEKVDKLLRLAFNKNASEGEIVNSIKAVNRILQSRNLTIESYLKINTFNSSQHQSPSGAEINRRFIDLVEKYNILVDNYSNLKVNLELAEKEISDLENAVKVKTVISIILGILVCLFIIALGVCSR